MLWLPDDPVWSEIDGMFSTRNAHSLPYPAIGQKPELSKHTQDSVNRVSIFAYYFYVSTRACCFCLSDFCLVRDAIFA